MTFARRLRRPRIVLGLLVLAVVATSFLAAAADLPVLPSGALHWDAARPVGWGDFRAVPPADAARRTEIAAIAMTISWSLRFEVTCVPGKSEWKGSIVPSSLEVLNWMDPARSWASLERRSEAVLRHEQRHFDLNEVYRRKLELTLVLLKAAGADAEGAKRTLDAMIHAAAQRLLDTLATQQDRYDLETSHGASVEGQARWDAQIVLWLVDPAKAP